MASAGRAIALAALLGLVVAGCDHEARDAQRGAASQPLEMRADFEPAPPPMAPAAIGRGAAPGMTASLDVSESGGQPALPTAMLIRTGQIAVEVDSIERGVAAIEALAARVGGYVSQVGVTGGQRENRSGHVEIRVPSARFDEVVAGLPPLGKVLSVSVHSQDVGEEFVDVQARLVNARRLEERLIALLGTRAGRLEDVLALERELARVRGEIERYEGRIRYLRSRAEMSSLSVTLQEPRPLLAQRPGARPIRDAFGTAWRNFIGFVALAIEAMGVLVPLAVLAAVGFLIWRQVKLRRPPPPAGEGW